MAQPFNYDEAKVPKFTLPDSLKMVDGSPVKTVKDWETKRRPEVLALFEKEVYGKAPGKPAKLSFAVLEQSKNVLGGTADRKQVQVRFAGTPDGPRMTMLIYSPAKATGAVDVELELAAEAPAGEDGGVRGERMGFLGKWEQSSMEAEKLEAILKAQGYGWPIRKIALGTRLNMSTSRRG